MISSTSRTHVRNLLRSVMIFLFRELFLRIIPSQIIQLSLQPTISDSPGIVSPKYEFTKCKFSVQYSLRFGFMGYQVWPLKTATRLAETPFLPTTLLQKLQYFEGALSKQAGKLHFTKFWDAELDSMVKRDEYGRNLTF